MTLLGIDAAQECETLIYKRYDNIILVVFVHRSRHNQVPIFFVVFFFAKDHFLKTFIYMVGDGI